MPNVFRGILVAAVACIVGMASTAWACCAAPGRVVCAGTEAGVPDVKVIFATAGMDPQAVVSDANGNFETWYAWCGLSYDLTLDLTGAGEIGAGALVSEPPVFCDTSGTATPAYLLYEVGSPYCGEPPPPPVKSADCSPGYYKNHPETWCVACGYGPVGGAACLAAIAELSARGPGSSEVRDERKDAIDACFVTGAASPCADDD